MVEGVLSLGDRRVTSLMTPRTEVACRRLTRWTCQSAQPRRGICTIRLLARGGRGSRQGRRYATRKGMPSRDSGKYFRAAAVPSYESRYLSPNPYRLLKAFRRFKGRRCKERPHPRRIRRGFGPYRTIRPPRVDRWRHARGRRGGRARNYKTTRRKLPRGRFAYLGPIRTGAGLRPRTVSGTTKQSRGSSSIERAPSPTRGKSAAGTISSSRS